MNRCKRCTAVLVLGLFMLVFCTGTALADQGKEQFINNVAAFQAAALKVNPYLSEKLSGQIHFQVDMKDFPVDDVTVPQAVTGDILYKVDASKSRAWFQIRGYLAMNTGRQPFEAEAFFDDGMLIIPAASLKTMNPVLFGNLPVQYLYMDLSDEMPDETEFYEALMTASDQRVEMVAAYQDLLASFVKPLPDRCFAVSGSGSSTLKMEYTDFMILIKAFEDPTFQEEIAGKIANLFPADAGITQEDIIESFARPDKTEDSAGPDSVQVRQFEMTASPQGFKSACDVSMSDAETRIDLIVHGQTDVTSSSLVQKTDFQMKVDDRTDQNNDIAVKATFAETDKADSVDFAMDFALHMTENGRTGKIGLGLSGNAKADDNVNIAVPVLTEANSMDMSAFTGEDTQAKEDATMLEYQGKWFSLSGAFIEQGRMMVSVFDISRIFNLQQSQDDPTQAILSDGQKQVAVKAGSSNYQVGTETKDMEVAAIYRDYEIFVPVSIILQEFGYRVYLDDVTGILHVVK